MCDVSGTDDVRKYLGSTGIPIHNLVFDEGILSRKVPELFTLPGGWERWITEGDIILGKGLRLIYSIVGDEKGKLSHASIIGELGGKKRVIWYYSGGREELFYENVAFLGIVEFNPINIMDIAVDRDTRIRESKEGEK